jgi:hypothetical protein
MSSSRRIKFNYNIHRYWYHVSTTLNKPRLKLIPWDNSKGFNRAANEPDVARICVAPTIEQCITAIPYVDWETYNIYRTEKPVAASPPSDVFDSNITQEGWIKVPTVFVKVGKLVLNDVSSRYIVMESASSNSPQKAGKVLAWWNRQNIRKYVQWTKM